MKTYFLCRARNFLQMQRLLHVETFTIIVTLKILDNGLRKPRKRFENPWIRAPLLQWLSLSFRELRFTFGRRPTDANITIDSGLYFPRQYSSIAPPCTEEEVFHFHYWSLWFRSTSWPSHAALTKVLLLHIAIDNAVLFSWSRHP